MDTIWIVVIAIIAVILLWLLLTYNGLITLRNRLKEAWADIDVQLKRRYDLIPNLIETVKGYAAQEREVFAKVTEMRASAMTAQGPLAKAQAENMLTQALKSLFAAAENYPDLKSSANFLELQREISDTENKIQAARRFYNGNVRDFNTKIEVFPNNLVAGAFGFSNESFFELAEEEAKKSVKVDFQA